MSDSCTVGGTPPRIDAPSRVLPAGKLKRLHVNMHNIRDNVRDKGNRPTITIKYGGATLWCHDAEVKGDSRFVASLDKPLSCGARVWIETRAAVLLYTDDAHDL